MVSRSILLRPENVLDKNCRDNQNTSYVQLNISENRVIYEIRGKIWYSRTGHRWKI